MLITTRKQRVLAAVLATCLHTAPATAAANPDLLQQARRLINSNQAEQAYHLLSAAEEQLAGELDYDYLLGTAALEARRPSDAIVALERVIATHPQHFGAQLDLARAHVISDAHELARASLVGLLGQDPPPAARQAINLLLEATDRAYKARYGGWSGYLEAGLGYDTNINNSTSNSPTGIVLDSSDLQQHDFYNQLSLGGEFRYRLDPRWGLFAAADARARLHESQHEFNSTYGSARAGVLHKDETARPKIYLTIDQMNIDGIRNRNTLGLAAEWIQQLSPQWQATLFGQGNMARFQRGPDGSLKSESYNQTVAGAGLTRLLGSSGAAVSLSIFGGYENAIAGRLGGDKKLASMRAGLQAPLSPNTLGYLQAGSHHAHYEQRNLTLLIMGLEGGEHRRKDHGQDLSLGLVHRLGNNWVLRPQVSYSVSRSNQSLYSYNRLDVGIALRKDFQ